MKLVKTADQVIEILDRGKKKSRRKIEDRISEHFAPPDQDGLLVPSTPNPIIKETFKVYEAKKLQAAIKDYNEWVRYKYKAGSDFSVPNHPARERYELYCCGWLEYFDTEVRDGKIDHSIYFIWTKTEVVIKIWPLYSKEQKSMMAYVFPPGAGDPPTPKGPPPPY